MWSGEINLASFIHQIDARIVRNSGETHRQPIEIMKLNVFECVSPNADALLYHVMRLMPWNTLVNSNVDKK